MKKRLLEYLKKLPQSKLKLYLGENIVDALEEWQPGDSEGIITSKKYAEMLLAIRGENIIKDRNVRADIVSQLPISKLDELIIITGADKGNYEMLVEFVRSSSWGNNKVIQYLINFLEIDEQILNPPNDELNTLEVVAAPTQTFYELLDYQYYIKQRILNILNYGNKLTRILVHMPTGTGKTKTSMHTITSYYTNTLKNEGAIIWIAHTKELLLQAYETFNQVWSHIGKGEVNTYKLWENRTIEDFEQGINGVVFCGLSKLMAIKGTDLYNQLLVDCRLIVFDEAHKAAAQETRKIIEQFMTMDHGKVNRAILGLTATPGRVTANDNGNTLLAQMFENRLISIDTETVTAMNMSQLEAMNTAIEEDIIPYFQKRRILATIKKEELRYSEAFTDVELTKIRVDRMNNGDKDFSKKTLEMIGRKRSRNLAIFNKLKDLNSRNIPTIVFACSVEHGQLLSAMLTLDAIPNTYVIGDMEPWERKKAIEDFKDRKNPTNIIINYEVLTTGFDSTNIACVFITRPTQSIVLYSQMIGRGLRGPQMGGNEECLLIDVKDNLLQFDEKMAFNHFKNYWR